MQIRPSLATVTLVLRQDRQKKLVLEDLRAAFNAALQAARGDPRDRLRLMREAVIEAKTSISKMRDGVAATRKRLDAERTSLDDAERRGGMATEIGDQETATVAAEFAGKHREKVAVLERKLAAQEAELALGEREVAEMTANLKSADKGAAIGESSSTPLNQREETADRSAQFDELATKLDNESREALAEEQLQELKKKMGK
ncbi:MAG: hypothetical protein V3R24_03560 [Gemmatimonadales bacterium]